MRIRQKENKFLYKNISDIKIFSVNCSLLIVLCSLLIVSCSTTKKDPGYIEILRTQAEKWLESGNKEAGLGKFESSLNLLTETKRNSILADDHSLIVRVCLSRGNVLYSLGRYNEAFAEWEQAAAEAVKLEDAELLSVSRIYLARGNLISERMTAGSVLDEVNRESANIKKNRLYIAFSWQVKGLAQRALGSYNEAEDSFRRSLEIHQKDSYFESASYDWYAIASIRSLSGNTQGAIQALETSIGFDRRVENSWGLAASYRTLGDVYKKAGNQKDALESYKRARAIYAAMGHENEVAETDNRIKGL